MGTKCFCTSVMFLHELPVFTSRKLIARLGSDLGLRSELVLGLMSGEFVQKKRHKKALS